jgi:macrolide-specific efflux system membrane fusion protein
LKKIHVEVGQAVSEGDLLAEIDAEQSAAKVEASLAQLRSLEAQLEQRRLALVKAERDFVRLRNLVAEEAATLESLQNAETEAASMKAQMAQLRAQIEQLRATTRVEETNLKFAKIYAPMSGTVVSITAKQGQTLNANQSAPNLLRIADLAVMNVETQVSEADVSKLRVGMDAYFTTLGGQGRRWYGKLTKIEPTPTVTNNVVLYNALFEVPNERGALMTQMTAQVFFVVAQVRDVLFVPMSALGQIGVARPQEGGGQGGQDSPRGRSARGGGEGKVEGQGEGKVEGRNEGRGGEAEPPSGRFRMNGEGRERRRGERGERAGERGMGERGGERNMGERRAGEETLPARQREAIVKVIRPNGDIEERKVTIGVSNRIHAEVIAGLSLGETVVAGTREREGARPAAAEQRPQQSQLQQPVPGMPGGMGRGR